MKILLVVLGIFSSGVWAHEEGEGTEIECLAALTVDSINNLVINLAQQSFEATVTRQVRLTETGSLKLSEVQALGQPFGVSVQVDSVAANAGQIEMVLILKGTARELIAMLVTLDARYKNAPLKWLKPEEPPIAATGPALPPAPLDIQVPLPTPIVSPPPARGQAAFIGLVDFTQGRRHEDLVPPSPTALTERNPIAYVTQRGKVGWAVVHGGYFLRTDLDDLFAELQKEVPDEISAHVKSQTRALKISLAKPESDVKVIPKHMSAFTSGVGAELLFELMDSGSVYFGIPRDQKDLSISQQDRLVVIPIGRLQREARTRNPPVVTRPGAEHEIQILLPANFNLGLYGVSESDLFRHLKQGLNYHLSEQGDDSDTFRQVYNAKKARDTYFVRYRISPLRGGGRLIEVLSLESASTGEQKSFWRAVADQFGFEDITIQLPFGHRLFMAGGRTFAQVFVSKQVHAKLVAKHELSKERIVELVGRVRSVSPSRENPGLFGADIKTGRNDTYHIGVALNQDSVVLTTLFLVN